MRREREREGGTSKKKGGMDSERKGKGVGEMVNKVERTK